MRTKTSVPLDGALIHSIDPSTERARSCMLCIPTEAMLSGILPATKPLPSSFKINRMSVELIVKKALLQVYPHAFEYYLDLLAQF